MEIKDYLDIIEDAKKYFFAEDIISYCMISCSFKPYFQIPITKRCFRLIPRAFNDVIETAVCFLYARISVFNTFRSFEDNEMIRAGTFLVFANYLEYRYFSLGFNPQKLLYFCTHLAYMAISFYKSGRTHIPKLAVYKIARSMKKYKVPETDFWNGLSIAALRYIKIAFKCGFAKLSNFECMKIQFVVYLSFKEKTAGDNDRTAECSSSEAVLKSDLLKLSAELKRKISQIDFCNKNNQSTSKTETQSALYEENINRELSDHNSTDSKKRPEIGVDEKSIRENKLDTKCTDPLTITSDFERIILQRKSFQRKYHVFQVLSGMVNTPTVCPFSENCECLRNTNADFVSKDMQSSAMDTETSRNLKRESNATSTKNNSTERTDKISKYFDETEQEIQSSTTVIHGLKLPPSISGDKHGEFISANYSHKKSPNYASNEESFRNTDRESVTPHPSEKFSKAEESETEDCSLKTVDYDMCDKFVMDMAKDKEIWTSRTDIELYGETHESFLSNEDCFNSTFDILSVVHHMAKHLGIEILDIETAD